jgi:hypothetical protein
MMVFQRASLKYYRLENKRDFFVMFDVYIAMIENASHMREKMDAKTDSLALGIVLERRDSDHPWLDHEWVFVAVIPGAPPASGLRVLREHKGVTQFHAGTLDIELHRAEAEAYHYNLSSAQPSLFVVLRDGDEAAPDAPIHVSLVTANPYEAQDYLDSSEEQVERILMPDDIRQWVTAFVDTHYTPQEFKKRKRDRLRPEEYKFGQEPLAEISKRMPATQEAGEEKRAGDDVKNRKL